MINISFGSNMFLSMILGIGIIIFYGLKKVKPELARDEDLFFVTLILFYCIILAVHGWRLDPILLFSQVLIITSLLFAGWESVRLRGMVHNYQKRENKRRKKR